MCPSRGAGSALKKMKKKRRWKKWVRLEEEEDKVEEVWVPLVRRREGAPYIELREQGRTGSFRVRLIICW